MTLINFREVIAVDFATFIIDEHSEVEATESDSIYLFKYTSFSNHMNIYKEIFEIKMDHCKK